MWSLSIDHSLLSYPKLVSQFVMSTPKCHNVFFFLEACISSLFFNYGLALFHVLFKLFIPMSLFGIENNLALLWRPHNIILITCYFTKINFLCVFSGCILSIHHCFSPPFQFPFFKKKNKKKTFLVISSFYLIPYRISVSLWQTTIQC